ncbi:MAG: helix-turn-helix domain-containing protein [Gallintestinimicrobium sp.]
MTKSDAGDKKEPKSWLKSVSAFANGVGGVLIFGIADNRFCWCGVDDAKKAMEVISEQIKTKMDPIPEVLAKSTLK